jgi:DNA polymerase III epsilon subunit family exonuclease
MDKILKFISTQTNNKYPDLLFFGANFNKKTNFLTLDFSSLPKQQKNAQNVAEIESICKQYFRKIVDGIKVNFRSNSLTMEEFKTYLFDKILSYNQLANIDPTSITFDYNDDITVLNIPYQDASLNTDVLAPISAEIQSVIKAELHQDVELHFEQIKQDKSVIESRKDRILEDNLVFEEMKKAQIVDISNAEIVFGDFKATKAYLAGDISELGTEICVVGNVKECFKRETKPKVTEDDTNANQNAEASTGAEVAKPAKQGREYLAITLEYDGATTKCFWFFAKDFSIEPFPVGTTLAISGKMSEYNGSKSLRASSVAKCTFVPPKKVYRKCPTQYRYISPEPYEFTEQTNLFFADEKTKNKYLLNNTFVVYDLETTGINAANCKIIDIGAYKIVDGKITEKFCTFVNPECEIPEEASKVNRITNALVADAPTIEMALPDFYKFCYGSTIVGYNNIGFDDLFIAKEAKKQFYNFSNNHDDAFNIAKKNLPGLRNYKLSTVCEYMNVPLIDAHRAANDALATAKLFIKLAEKFC